MSGPLPLDSSLAGTIEDLLAVPFTASQACAYATQSGFSGQADVISLWDLTFATAVPVVVKDAVLTDLELDGRKYQVWSWEQGNRFSVNVYPH